MHLWKASAVVDEEQKDLKQLRAKSCSPVLIWSIQRGRKIVYSIMDRIAEDEPSPSAHPVLLKNPLSLSVTLLPCFCPFLHNDATIPETFTSLRWCTHNKYLTCASAGVFRSTFWSCECTRLHGATICTYYQQTGTTKVV